MAVEGRYRPKSHHFVRGVIYRGAWIVYVEEIRLSFVTIVGLGPRSCMVYYSVLNALAALT
jgi:Xaa-Pro aminopeptidase